MYNSHTPYQLSRNLVGEAVLSAAGKLDGYLLLREDRSSGPVKGGIQSDQLHAEGCYLLTSRVKVKLLKHAAAKRTRH